MMYLQLFWEFFKAGLFAVGGGMATIPFLYDISDKTGWFTHQDLANMIAVGESTPGPIGVNMATYVGFVTGMQDAGLLTAILGAVTATIGLITPSVIIILIVAAVLKSFRNNPYVERAFYGLRPVTVGLIAAASLLLMNSENFIDYKSVLIFIVAFLLTWKFKISPILMILIAATAGIILY